MPSRVRRLPAGAIALILLSVASGRAGASAPETAPSGAAPPKATAPDADTKSPPATKKDVPEVKASGNSAPKTAKAADAAGVADVEKAAKPNAKPLTHKKAGPPKPRAGEGPSPAMPPPLTIGGLRDEVRREAGPVTIDPSAPARTKVEQMLAEITKTREALREATGRLEALMGDGAEPATAGASSGGAPGPGSGKPASKNPLDVLAKALRGIKPEQAAPIVARLDKRLAATVLLRMPPVDAGKIMGALKPDTAAELATQISVRVTPGEVKR